MKKFSCFLIVVAIIIGVITDYLPKDMNVAPFVCIAWYIFLIAMVILINDGSSHLQ